MLTLRCNFWTIEKKNEKNEKKGYLYNLMLKNIPYHIVADLKSIPIMPAHPPEQLLKSVMHKTLQN